MRAIRHIVVIRPGALGDTLLTLPALALLRRRWPAARLTFVGRRDTLPLITSSGLASTTHPYDAPDWAALFAETPPALGLAADTLRDCDLAIAWLADPDAAVARNLRDGGVQRVVVAPGRPPAGSQDHAALTLARTLAPLGFPLPRDLAALVLPVLPVLPILHRPLNHPPHTTTDRATASMRIADAPSLVAIHPGSGSVAKRWPPERFAAITARLAAAGYHPLLIQGPQDEPVLRQVLSALRPEQASPTLTPEMSLLDLAGVLARCAAYLGNDSGVSHLAGLLGLPALALFGPTDPTVWSPLGPHVRTLRAPSHTMDGLSEEAVDVALRSLLPPAPA